MRNRWMAVAVCLGVAAGWAAAGWGQAAAAGGMRPAGMFYLGADISGLAGGRGGRAAGARGAATMMAGTQAGVGRGGVGGVGGGGRGMAGGYQENGQPGSEIGIMMNHGWNTFRLRVFVDPVRAAPNNSLANTIPLAKQIKAAGGVFLLDIHYSDTWADPQHQETPLAWRNLDVDGLEKQVESYSKDVIEQLKAAGAMPEMVQVGNEITGGMLWPLGHVKVPPSDVKLDAGRIQALPEPYDDAKQWGNLIRFIKAGTRGVRAGAGDTPVKTVIHIDCGGDWPVTKWYFDHLTEAGVDYDIIGQSFYPNWHGTLEELQGNMIQCAQRYHKPFMVVETGYPQTGGEAVLARNKYMLWPGTPAGQLQFMADLVNTVQRNQGMGVYYWAPEGRGGGNGMWNADGSPAPSIMVLEHLKELTTRPGSRLPEGGK